MVTIGSLCSGTGAVDPASYAELRARLLLALALLNHRATADGLGMADLTAVRGALLGEWDKAVA